MFENLLVSEVIMISPYIYWCRVPWVGLVLVFLGQDMTSDLTAINFWLQADVQSFISDLAHFSWLQSKACSVCFRQPILPRKTMKLLLITASLHLCTDTTWLLSGAHNIWCLHQNAHQSLIMEVLLQTVIRSKLLGRRIEIQKDDFNFYFQCQPWQRDQWSLRLLMQSSVVFWEKLSSPIEQTLIHLGWNLASGLPRSLVSRFLWVLSLLAGAFT